MIRWLARVTSRGTLVGCLAVSSACGSADAGPKAAPTQARAEVIFVVDGMACDACASRLEAGLLRIDGVHEASVTFATARARVVYDPALAGDKVLSDAIVALGFENRPAAP